MEIAKSMNIKPDEIGLVALSGSMKAAIDPSDPSAATGRLIR
jgi:hypothetical protein